MLRSCPYVAAQTFQLSFISSRLSSRNRTQTLTPVWNPTLEIFKVPFSVSGSSEILSYRVFLDKLNILLCGGQLHLAIFSVLWGLHCYLHEFKLLYILQPLDDQEHGNTFPNTLDTQKKTIWHSLFIWKTLHYQEQLVSCSHSFASSPHSLACNFHLILHPVTFSSTF